MIEKIIKRFDEKFARESRMFRNAMAEDEMRQWLTQELLALQEKTRDEIASDVIDWVWDGWNLDLSKKDRAKEHFKAKYLSKNTKGESK